MVYTFEVLQAVWKHGGSDPLFSFFKAFFAGLVSEDIVALVGDLRAVLFYKDEARTKLRPIGIGESLRRLTHLQVPVAP